MSGVYSKLSLFSQNKKGQFFILASVLLSVFLLSMALTVNEVVANEPDYNLHNYANNLEKEVSSVLDYQVYSNIPIANLNDFVSILETDFREREVDGNFMVIYGNQSMIKIRNIGTEGIAIDDSGSQNLTLNGASNSVRSKIRVGGFGSINVNQFNNENTELTLDEASIGNSINISFNEQNYIFPISDVNQVIFIIQKDVNDETFVEIR